MEFPPITREQVISVVRENPGLKQPQLLDLIYPGDPGIEVVEGHPEGGNPIKKPHLELERILRSLVLDGIAYFTPRNSSGGWHIR